jgi:hypothetical protein
MDDIAQDPNGTSTGEAVQLGLKALHLTYPRRADVTVGELGDVAHEEVSDMIANLLMLVYASGEDWRSVLDTALSNFHHETDESVVVHVENTYTCGRQSEAWEIVPVPDVDEDMDAWWAEKVPTGDGHPCGAHEHALYECKIVVAPDRPELVGLSYGSEG